MVASGSGCRSGSLGRGRDEQAASSERPAASLVRTPDGAQLAVEAFGSPSDPTVLLIAGGGQSMDWWEIAFCQRLAAADRQVVRYDHRDTGWSTSSPPGEPTYAGVDLANDPLVVLDALGVDRAHIVGMSMGGGIAQRIAIEHPERVRTLTLVSTSPIGSGSEEKGLPPVTPELKATWEEPIPEPDWSDLDAVIAYRTEIERPYAGSFDERRVRRLAEIEVRRTPGMAASITNHFTLDDHWSGRSDRITAPTLVPHGTADPLFPFSHGAALAREIHGARLVPLEGVGHEIFPPEHWDTVLAALVTHTDR